MQLKLTPFVPDTFNSRTPLIPSAKFRKILKKGQNCNITVIYIYNNCSYYSTIINYN